MIQEFSVENFLSFGDQQTISFEATSDKSYMNDLITDINGTKILRVAMIYGANASGKSNILLAIQAVWSMLFIPKTKKGDTIEHYIPFALTKDKPTIFEITFWADNIKYMYAVEFDKNCILTEKLKFYKKHSKTELFYERTGQSRISFGDKLKLTEKTKDDLIRNTLENHTVLSTFAKTNILQKNTPIEKLYNWIKSSVHEIDNHDNLLEIIEEAQNDDKMKQFFASSFLQSDFNIVDFNVVERTRELNQEFIDTVNSDSDLTNKMKQAILNPIKKDIEFTHKTELGDFTISGKLESKGTLSSISLFRKIYDLLSCNCTYLIDEIGENLHPDLVKHIILTYIRSSSVNSQLIFTTHNQLLLNEDFVRRDMVWFTEKSESTAKTELFSAAEFKMHKNISLFNSYRTGKFGAKPSLGSTLIKDTE